MNRAVVLGGSGFIGGRLVKALVEQGYETVSVDQRPPRFPLGISSDRYQFAQGELFDPDFIDSLLAPGDLVFHLASVSLPETSNQNMLQDLTATVGLTIFLLERCARARIRKAIFLSSGGTVYGVNAGCSITEDHATEPLSAYGIGKLTCEKYLGLFRQLFGMDHTILRVANAYGERQDPFGRQGIIAVVLGKIFRGQPVEIWGDGNVVRDFVHVDDVVRACLLAAATDTEHRVFNIGTNTGVSLNGLLDEIRTTLGAQFEVRYAPARAFDVPRVVLDYTRARQDLGWSPGVSLGEGLKGYWQWLQRM